KRGKVQLGIGILGQCEYLTPEELQVKLDAIVSVSGMMPKPKDVVAAAFTLPISGMLDAAMVRLLGYPEGTKIELTGNDPHIAPPGFQKMLYTRKWLRDRLSRARRGELGAAQGLKPDPRPKPQYTGEPLFTNGADTSEKSEVDHAH